MKINALLKSTIYGRRAIKTKCHLICFVSIMLIVGCQHKETPSQIELESIGLLRGDITICSTGDFGEVSFGLSCDPKVGETFDLAISLLHSFEYDQAEKAFVRVIDADPECAMAYWGVAMSNFHSLWFQSGSDYLKKGSKIIEACTSLSKSERENDYIKAIASFYQNWNTDSRQERITRFEENMKNVYEKYSDDKEAAIFYALALRATADPKDKSYKNQKESGRILESIYPSQPSHPGIAHYIIHNYDYPELAELALPAARSYAKIAPASAHAQHMPSHIFTRLGLWEESINSNINMVSAAQCYSQSLDSIAHWDEELHGMDYLVYAYLQTGQNKEANEQYEYLETFERAFPVNFKVAYTAAAIPARMTLENRKWAEAANIQFPPIAVDWRKFPWQRSILHFARGLGSVRSGDIESAEEELGILQSNHQELIDINDQYKANQVHIQIKTLTAWIQWSRGDRHEALALMEEAAEMEYNTAKHAVTPGEVLPARELLGDLLLLADKPVEALEVFEKNLLQRPNRFNGIYGAAIAAKQAGNQEKANIYFELLLEVADPNSDRPEIQEAKNTLRQI